VIILKTKGNTTVFTGTEAGLKETAMPNARISRFTAPVQVLDSYQVHERAHHERSKAIAIMVSSIWSRLTSRRRRAEQDARFWGA